MVISLYFLFWSFLYLPRGPPLVRAIVEVCVATESRVSAAVLYSSLLSGTLLVRWRDPWPSGVLRPHWKCFVLEER